jgi:two-component SAPR family response regulator
MVTLQFFLTACGENDLKSHYTKYEEKLRQWLASILAKDKVFNWDESYGKNCAEA